MQNVTTAYSNAIASPMRQIRAIVKGFESKTATTFTDYSDRVKNLTIERIGEDNKFFGFGVCQRLNVHLIDTNSNINFGTLGTKNLEVQLGVVLQNNTVEYKGFPKFYLSEVNRNETNGELSITAYDLIYKTSSISFYDLDLTAPYSLRDCAEAAATYLGITVDGVNGDEWNTEYPEGANFEEADTVRDMLTMLAEATQSIYYIGYDNVLHFKRLITANPDVLTLNGDLYTKLSFRNVGHRLQTIASVTELGDNYSASTSLIGSTQYIRDNGFWTLREDIADLVDQALAYAGNMTIYTFDCDWRGNPALEIGDKIGITNKAGDTYSSYVLNDTISFDGSLKERTLWKYENDDAETETNPTSLGDVLKQTYAKVDKANKQITILASDVEDATDKVSQINLTTDKISASVVNINDALEKMPNQIQALNDTVTEQNLTNFAAIDELNKKVEATMTADEVNIAISKAIESGTANGVQTVAGYTFNEEGLIITGRVLNASDEITTQISNYGLEVKQNGTPILTAGRWYSSDGSNVTARDLKAETYLHIGTNSRFEDWNSRTACFWIN